MALAGNLRQPLIPSFLYAPRALAAERMLGASPAASFPTLVGKQRIFMIPSPNYKYRHERAREEDRNVLFSVLCRLYYRRHPLLWPYPYGRHTSRPLQAQYAGFKPRLFSLKSITSGFGVLLKEEQEAFSGIGVCFATQDLGLPRWLCIC
ncbi:uncharacterized protein J3R85_014094 [Psidium guajava]|nr:uncharacterized protein J3R85_014094 [Psidium guajava]